MFNKLDLTFIDSMERGILSTILFDNNTIKDVKENIFSNQQYKNIFDVMQELNKNNFPINEEAIVAKLGNSYEQTLINIITTNPLTQIKSIYNELQENNYKIFLQDQLRKIASSDSNSIDKINELQDLIIRSRDFKRQELFNLVDFSNVKEKTPNFLLEDVLPIQENEINIISAAGGSGKSYLSLYLALNYISKYKENRAFLWLSEDEIGVSKKRALSLCKVHHNLTINQRISVLGKETQVFHFVDKNLNINTKFEEMKQQLKDFSLIVIDPLIAFFGADENSNADARFFMSLLNKWCVDENKTIILIHHHSKASGTSKTTARGASAFIDACRMHYVIEKVENDSRSRKVVIDKTNHFSNDKKDYIIKLFDVKVEVIPYKETEKRVPKKYSVPLLGDIEATEVDEL
ncbi:replicative DNA helicase [Aliarcobacter cibarius]|uniref:Replicative DNA helicase n=1 Tax=Aliarcobacter cibarius TaxID=255507 RepID=A0A7L5JLY7_9BACT|nr:AAA family ATPase [Aliarcobacter cibarius]QKJ26147.1 replicative DNA helicase [Aliarcobacter cibarius]